MILLRHGGSGVSQYLRQELHGLFESADKASIPELYTWIKEIGGYFKRFTGGALTPWIRGVEDTPRLDLEARATQTFFEVETLFAVLFVLCLNILQRLTDICPPMRWRSHVVRQLR